MNGINPAANGLCNTCYSMKPGMKQCGRCKKVFYCSVDCQKTDWKNHKSLCNRVTVREPDQRKETRDLNNFFSMLRSFAERAPLEELEKGLRRLGVSEGAKNQFFNEEMNFNDTVAAKKMGIAGLVSQFPKEGAIVSLGEGIGASLRAVCESLGEENIKDRDITAVEIDSDASLKSKAHLPKHAKTVCEDMKKYVDGLKGEVSFFVLIESIGHLNHKGLEALLKSIHRQLSSKGKVLISITINQNPQPGHPNKSLFKSLDQAESLLCKAGFTIAAQKNLPGSMEAVIGTKHILLLEKNRV